LTVRKVKTRGWGLIGDYVSLFALGVGGITHEMVLRDGSTGVV